jgi:FtsH-binding integral membrane protein
MLDQIFGSWWPTVSSYLAGPLALAGGTVSPFTVIPTVGFALLLLGIIAAILWREKQAVWVIGPIVAAALTPVVLAISNILGGWFVVMFALVIGAVGLLLWIGIISGDATRRLPVWLLGLFAVNFVVYCTAVSVAIIWGLA